jgi:hypothetical protein
MEPLFSSVRYFQVLVWSRYLRRRMCLFYPIDVLLYVRGVILGHLRAK